LVVVARVLTVVITLDWRVLVAVKFPVTAGLELIAVKFPVTAGLELVVVEYPVTAVLELFEVVPVVANEVVLVP
jgi:hypothetical protein